MQYLYNGSPIPEPQKASDLPILFPQLIEELDREIADRVKKERETIREGLEHLGFSTDDQHAPQDHITRGGKVLEGSKIVFSDEDAALIEGVLG